MDVTVWPMLAKMVAVTSSPTTHQPLLQSRRNQVIPRRMAWCLQSGLGQAWRGWLVGVCGGWVGLRPPKKYVCPQSASNVQPL